MPFKLLSVELSEYIRNAAFAPGTSPSFKYGFIWCATVGELQEYVERQRAAGHNEAAIRDALTEAGWPSDRIDSVLDSATERRVTVIRWLALVLTTVLLLIATGRFAGITVVFAAAYAGLIAYFLLDRIRHLPTFLTKLAVPVVTYAVLTLGTKFWLSQDQLLTFGTIEILATTVIYALLPAVLFYLEELEYESDLALNPLFVFIHVILLNVIYYVYWFHTVRQKLAHRDLDTVSPLWLAFPVAGTLLVFHSYANAFRKVTDINYYAWFTVFLCLPLFGIVVAQSMLNQALAQQE